MTLVDHRSAIRAHQVDPAGRVAALIGMAVADRPAFVRLIQVQGRRP